jgi:hypothetical protein
MYSIVNSVSSAFFYYLMIKDDPYLDPGSGSFLIQLIIASLVGAAFVIRTFWSRIKSFFRRLFHKSDEELDIRDINEK